MKCKHDDSIPTSDRLCRVSEQCFFTMKLLIFLYCFNNTLASECITVRGTKNALPYMFHKRFTDVPYMLLICTRPILIRIFDFLEYDAPCERETHPLYSDTKIIMLSLT